MLDPLLGHLSYLLVSLILIYGSSSLYYDFKSAFSSLLPSLTPSLCNALAWSLSRRSLNYQYVLYFANICEQFPVQRFLFSKENCEKCVLAFRCRREVKAENMMYEMSDYSFRPGAQRVYSSKRRQKVWPRQNLHTYG